MKSVEIVSSIASSKPHKGQVLVVDDDPMALMLAEKVLGNDGFEVKTVENGVDAINVFLDGNIDIVLLDVEMPGMNGFDTCKAIRQLAGGDAVPILMITGREDKKAIESAFDAGATDFASKPLNWSILSHRVRYMVRAGDIFRDAQQTHARLVDAQRLAELGNWVWNISENRFYCSSEIFRIFNMPTNAKAIDFLRRVHPEDRNMVESALHEAKTHTQFFSIEYRLQFAKGTLRYVSMNGEPELTGNDTAVRITGTLQDITQRRQDEEKIRHLAYFDSLTGLTNRTTFKQRLFQAISQARNTTEHVAVLFIDLDDFKRINDTLGHSMGDRLLTTVAERLKDNIRANDCLGRSNMLGEGEKASDLQSVIARLGGDEYTVALTGIQKPAQAASIAQRILNVLSQPVILNNQEVQVTPSIGIALYPDDGHDVDTLITNADAAMYHSKAHGKNKYAFYTQSMNKHTLERLTMETQLRKALENHEFTLHYQPVISLEHDQMVGVEALIRWNNPDLGMVSPADFIPLAEETGLIIDIGEWVLNTACQQHRQWIDAGYPPLRIAVNLSPCQFQHHGLIATIQQALDLSGMDPDYLDLELTENLIMQDREQSIEALRTLREMRLRLSVDDFGTGYSSLSYLKRLPITVLKIDRSFIMDIPWNRDDIAITKAIIAMAHSLNLEVIAEGVETEEQLAFLRAQGCEEVQGFLLGRPQTADRITNRLAQQVQAVVESTSSV